ncbi:MAG: hypothetical protein RBS19_02480 [Bacteroidales bacterium]|nr:hypothetical protein [Bacteroidales bacterium]
MRQTILFIFFWVLTTLAYAQSGNTPFRLELDAPEKAFPYEIITLGEKGVIVYYESDIISRNTAKWSFVHFDVFFNRTWTKNFYLHRDLEPVKVYTDSINVGVLLNYQGKRKIEFPNQLVHINIQDTSSFAYTIDVSENTFPNHLMIGDKYTYFSLLSRDREVLYQLNNSSKTLRNFTPVNVKEIRIPFISQNPLYSDGILFGILSDVSKRTNQLQLKFIDTSGVLINELLIPEESRFFMNTANLIKTGKDSLLIVGNYVNSSDKSGTFSSPEISNTGIFAIAIHQNQIVNRKYYNFSRFENIYKYVTKQDLQRIRKRAKDDEDDSQPGYSLNLKLISQPPLLFDSVVVFVNEAYFAEYRTEENLSYDYYGRPFPNNRTIFDGYRFTNGIVCGLTPNGDLLWDNNFALNNILTYQLSPKITFFLDSTDLLMAYNFNGEIVTMIVQGNHVLQNLEYSKVENISSSDFVLENQKTDIVYWYDHYFLSYGYQTIRNTQKRGRSRANVFYMIKMIYDVQ